jgi:hypothetical protein
VTRDELVYPGLVLLDAPGQGVGVRLGRDRQLSQHLADRFVFQIGLVEQFESALARLSAASQAEQG